MKRLGKVFTLGASVLTLSTLCACWRTSAAQAQEQEKVVRLAELEIDPVQLDRYKAALKEEIEASVRLEPGVLTLYAVAVKGHPEQVRLFEIYAGMAAYHAHLESAHFKKYKSETAGMVKNLKLLETEPILLGAKGR